MFENLSDRLERSFKIIKGEGKITEINVAETLKDVRRALLDADVNYKVAKTFTDTVKQKALGMNVLTAVKPGQLMVKIVHDELAALMGGETVGLQLTNRPAIILMSGLQGSGKTTFSGKLANLLKGKQHKNPLLVACDVYRPAAIEQLRVVAEQVGVPVYSEPDNKNVVEIANNAIREAKAKGNDVVIVDTAGRLAVDEEMMDEIYRLKQALNPDETLFVVDSMTGQDAVNTAREFNDRLDIDGVVLTKLDGDTRGGAALSIRTVVTKPIKFVGTGEKMEAIDVFHPGRMADRILGMGDVVSLVERAQEQFDEEEAKRLQKKIQKNQFDFNDFYNQIQQIKKMGNLKDLAAMIPGVGKAIRDVDIDDNAFKGIEAIINNKKVLVGNEKLVNLPKDISVTDVGTILYVEIDNVFSGYIVISDEIKEDAKRAIKELKNIGIKKNIMLTGDLEKVAKKVGEDLELDETYSNLLPQDKVSKFEEIIKNKTSKGSVIFVGDGINDAPVLARADVGIAMGAMGSDAAIEAADVVIMTDEPSKIVTAIKSSKKTMKIAMQNMALAFGIKVLALILSALGIADMWMAVFADTGVTILAVLNSFRALKIENN